MFRNRGQEIITGLDIGTNAIKVLVALKKADQEELEVLAQVKKNCSGVRKGVVSKPEKVAEIIKLAIEEAQNLSGQKIKRVFFNINGSHMNAIFSKGTIAVSRADKRISEEDKERVICQAVQSVNLSSNQEIIDSFPKDFIVDGKGGIKEILGMEGIRLEAEVLLLCAFVPSLHNLKKAIQYSELQPAGIQFSPIAAAKSVLTPQQKELGVVLVDIGAETTGLAIFEEENLIHSTIFPIGSANITQDIAIGFKCDIDLAEKIKQDFGTCLPKKEKGEKYKRDKIKFPDSLIFSRKILNAIIGARVSEIFDQIDQELKKVSRQKSLPAGIVFTGGGAKLSQIAELAKKELKLPARVGKPRCFIGLEEDPSLATVCGLVLEGADSDKEKSFSDFNVGRGKEFFSKAKDWFRNFIP
ncbi:MAG: cell division protein FtsA [Candidatus Nealsonbacteria bacterium]|nr:cell division protein FtsA [Candidatus Nealsonbacteria bacterium]